MSFDLDALALPETVNVELKHPVSGTPLVDSDKKQLYIQVYGKGSKTLREASYKLASKQAIAQKKNRDLSPAEQMEAYTEFLASISISSNLSYKGEELNNKAAFAKLYADPKQSWITPQIDEAIGDSGSFLTQ